MPQNGSPLSGDVTQWIHAAWDPWTNWMGQLGFVNINVGATSSPDVEKKIITDIASYGSQIGRIAEALEVLVEQQLADPTKLTVDQVGVFTAFREQLREVRRAKERMRGSNGAD